MAKKRKSKGSKAAGGSSKTISSKSMQSTTNAVRKFLGSRAGQLLLKEALILVAGTIAARAAAKAAKGGTPNRVSNALGEAAQTFIDTVQERGAGSGNRREGTGTEE